jgi:hypothetical protein
MAILEWIFYFCVAAIAVIVVGSAFLGIQLRWGKARPKRSPALKLATSGDAEPKAKVSRKTPPLPVE